MKRWAAAFLGLMLAGWLGCSTSTEADATASVQQAIEKHLSGRTDLNPSNLRVVVEKVDYEGDRATASVTITARQDPKAQMQMMYRLRKTAEGWEVEPSQGSEAGAHGGGAAPAPQPGTGGAELPPGHPPVEGGEGGAADELPPGHPPVAEPKKEGAAL